MTRPEKAEGAASEAKSSGMTDAQRAKALARLSMRPHITSAAVIDKFCANVLGEVDFMDVAAEISESIKAVGDGNTDPVEAMLLGQAQALHMMFVSYARRAQVQEYQANLEAFFKMALKAQNQCRMTLETLATIKNPPVVFAKQANIAHGHQQVNNGAMPRSRAREEKEIPSNELLEDQDGKRLDTRTSGTAIGADKSLAALGEIDRAENT